MVSFSRENLHIHLPSKARLRTYSLLIPNPSYFLPLHTLDQLTRCIFSPFPQDLPIECVISMIFPCNFSRLCGTWSPSKPTFPKATWDWNKRSTKHPRDYKPSTLTFILLPHWIRIQGTTFSKTPIIRWRIPYGPISKLWHLFSKFSFLSGVWISVREGNSMLDFLWHMSYGFIVFLPFFFVLALCPCGKALNTLHSLVVQPLFSVLEKICSTNTFVVPSISNLDLDSLIWWENTT